ncbi:SCO7613 C-terminal domain-containing membrane protein [Streptomyces sp. TR06-5]|uniref:SCO7613 C-terminal domain-containing membrane protein n=1 Tax=Streptomyces sp. TR06-5 TaxID=3385976 RepID=UPI0039A30402
MTHRTPSGWCPACGRPLPDTHPPVAHCPRCGLPVTGPVADRLRHVEAELHRLDARRGALAAQRGSLLTQLRAAAAAPAGSAHPPGAPPLPPPWPPTAPPRPREASPHTARNVLLTLGGVLLTVAALAFTLLSWGSMGIGGRAAVLGTVTLLAVAPPALLLRRTLHATAEAVASVGLVLLLLDAYALRQVSLRDTDPLGYTAAALAVIAALWAAYGLLLPRPRAELGERGPGLRLPLPAAVVLAQLPVPLLAAAEGAGATGLAWALTATAGADALLAVALGGRRPLRAERITAAVAGLVAAVPALALTGWLSATAPHFPAALRTGALFLTGAAVLLLAARRERRLAAPLGSGAGLLLIAASGGLLRTLVPEATWVMPGYLLSAAALAGALAARTPAVRRLRRRSTTTGLLLAAAAVHVLALVTAVPALGQALLQPMARVATPWQGAPAGAAGATLLPGWPWAGDAGTPVLLAVPALVLLAAARLLAPGAPRRTATAGAVALAGATAVVAPLALGLSASAVTVWLAALVAVLVALPIVVPGEGVALTATVAAVVVGGSVTGWALADRTATVVVLAVLTCVFATAAGLRTRPAARTGKGATPARPAGAVGAVCAATAVLAAAGLARALPAAAGAPAPHAAFAVLGVAALTVPLAARLRTVQARDGAARTGGDHAVDALAVECTGYVAAGWAVVLTLGRPPLLALALALCGVLAGAVALRADRRPAGYAATVLFLLATWVRLYASQVSLPEAYTLPPAAVALGVGVLRARAVPGLSSWTAYGPALSCALLPSLVAVWGDPHWLRPLLLGAGALGVTLLGARLRLRAPLLAGALVLALVAGHELAPYVTQVIGALPRWLPPALAGTLLLGVGATYEQRMSDVRRVRSAWRRLG